MPTHKSYAAARIRQWDETLKGGLWYASLPQDLQRHLLNLAMPQKLSHGQCLLRRGDAPNGVFAILEGSIRVSAFAGLAVKTSEIILIDFQAPSWIGEMALFDPAPVTHYAHAVGSTRLLHFTLPALEQLLETYPAYWNDFGRLLADKFKLTLRAAEELMCMPARARVASRVLGIADGFGWTVKPYPRSGQKIKVLQSELALMLGYSRQTVNNLLVELQDAGWVVLGRNTIEIVDPVALQREARGLEPLAT